MFRQKLRVKHDNDELAAKIKLLNEIRDKIYQEAFTASILEYLEDLRLRELASVAANLKNTTTPAGE